MKRLLIDSFTNSLEAQMERETQAIAGLADGTADARKGIAAFVAKEAPSFEGQ